MGNLAGIDEPLQPTDELLARARDLGRLRAETQARTNRRTVYVPDDWVGNYTASSLGELFAAEVLGRPLVVDGDLAGGVEVRTRRAGLDLSLYPSVDRGQKLDRAYLLVWRYDDGAHRLVGWMRGREAWDESVEMKPYRDRPAFRYVPVDRLHDPAMLVARAAPGVTSSP